MNAKEPEFEEHHFKETLEALLKKRKAFENLKKFCAETGIAPASLSDYRAGTLPRLDALIRLARVFGVTLEQLAFGLDSTPFGRTYDAALYAHLNQGLTTVHDHQLRVMRITQETMSVFTRRLEEVVSLAADKYTAPAGILLDNELSKIESCSTEIRLIRLGLEYFPLDFQAPPPGQKYDPSTGISPKDHVLKMLADNLKLRNPPTYTYFLPRKKDASASWAGELKKRVVDPLVYLHELDLALIGEHCKFYEANMTSVAGCVLYKVRTRELVAIRDSFPAIVLEKAIVLRKAEQWIGFTLPPKPECQVNLLMEKSHLDNAIDVTERLITAKSTKKIDVV